MILRGLRERGWAVVERSCDILKKMSEKSIRVLIIARELTVLEHMQSLLQQCDVESMITTSDEAVRRWSQSRSLPW